MLKRQQIVNNMELAVHLNFMAALAVTAILIMPANAHKGATGVVKERMDLMSSLGKTMKSLNAMARGKTDYDHVAVKGAAEQILLQSKQMQSMFPEGSNQMPSVAKPEIWTRPGEFKALANALGTEAEKLGGLDKSGGRDALKQQFRRVGKTCSACHKPFRSKKRAP